MKSKNFRKSQNLLRFALILFSTIAVTPLYGQKLIDTSYEGVKQVYITIPKGSCEINSGGTVLRVQLNAESVDKIVPIYTLKKVGDTLRITQQSHTGSVQNYRPVWTITVPSHIDVFMRTGNGTLKIRNASLDITAEISKGDIILEQVEGSFNLKTANGNIAVDGLKIRGSTAFKASKGDCKIRLKENPEHDLVVSSVTGNVTLNLNHFDFQGLVKVTLSSKSKFVTDLKSTQTKSYTPSGTRELLTEQWIQIGQKTNQLLLSTDIGTVTLLK